MVYALEVTQHQHYIAMGVVGEYGTRAAPSSVNQKEAVHLASTSRKLSMIKLKDLKGTTKAFSTVYTTVLYFESLVGVMRASSPSMSHVASAYSLNSSGRGTTFSSFLEFMVSIQSCGCVRRMRSCVCACDKGFENVRLLPHVKPPYKS